MNILYKKYLLKFLMAHFFYFLKFFKYFSNIFLIWQNDFAANTSYLQITIALIQLTLDFVIDLTAPLDLLHL